MTKPIKAPVTHALPESLLKDTSPEGEAVRKYIAAQQKHDFSEGNAIFTPDAIFNGLLYKVNHRDALVPGFQRFVDHILISLEVEAATHIAGTDRYLVLFYVLMQGMDKPISMVDLLTMRDGKICRVDNCFDTDKVPDAIKDDGKEQSNA